MIGVTFAGEKYCFDCMHKYKIGDKKNDTYEFEFDLQTNDLSKLVKSIFCFLPILFLKLT